MLGAYLTLGAGGWGQDEGFRTSGAELVFGAQNAGTLRDLRDSWGFGKDCEGHTRL